jgi:broad specificity phosphatase PhoE
MLKIYLARHGQNEDNAEGLLNGHRDRPLTEKGLEQAVEIAGKIKESGIIFSHILSSPLIRAKQTADIIAKRNEFPQNVEIEPDLIERDFGSMTGVEQIRIEELCSPDIIKTPTVTYFLSPEGAETFPDLIRRAKLLINKLKARYATGNILLVSHGDFGKMLYAAYYDLPWMDVLKDFHFGNSELLLMSEDSPPEETHVFKIEQHNH